MFLKLLKYKKILRNLFQNVGKNFSNDKNKLLILSNYQILAVYIQ